MMHVLFCCVTFQLSRITDTTDNSSTDTVNFMCTFSSVLDASASISSQS